MVIAFHYVIFGKWKKSIFWGLMDSFLGLFPQRPVQNISTFFWMGGVLHRRDDDKADGKTDSKTDIKIKDNGKDKGHCIRSYDSIGSLQRVIWLNDCHISTAWDKWDSEMTRSLCNNQRPSLVSMLVRVISIVIVKSAFSWLLVEASGFLPKNQGWALILTLTNPCFGTLGKDFTYIDRN